MCSLHMNKVLGCYILSKKVLGYYKTCNVEEDHRFVTFEIKYMFNVLIKHINVL